VRITVDVRDGYPQYIALTRIGKWYMDHLDDPKKNPMTGVVIYDDGMVLYKREYRKSDCFVAYYDASKDKSKEESA
jgi:hypothetical protein